MTTAMAFAISTPASSLLHSSSSSSSSSVASTGCINSLRCAFSSSPIAIPRNAIFFNVRCNPQLGFTPFAEWSGLKSLGISISRYPVKTESNGKWKRKGVYASLFGVGAPEVLVIGVVALLVFGPKGLAEVARNMGKTIRAFQPTIKELQEVSREFKSTLEREIGLDDEPIPRKSSTDPARPRSEASGTNSEPDGASLENVDPASQARADWLRGALDQLKKEQEEEQLKEAHEEAQSKEESQTASHDTPQASDTAQEASLDTPPNENNPHQDSPLGDATNQNSLQEAAAVAAPTDDPTAKVETEI